MYFLKKSIGEEIMCKRFNLGIFFSIYMLCRNFFHAGLLFVVFQFNYSEMNFSYMLELNIKNMIVSSQSGDRKQFVQFLPGFLKSLCIHTKNLTKMEHTNSQFTFQMFKKQAVIFEILVLLYKINIIRLWIRSSALIIDL